MNEKLRPIFFDRTGKRSWAVYFIIIASVISFVTFIIVIIPPVLSPERAINQASAKPNDKIVRQITDYANDNNVPIIGQGPFVRIVSLATEADTPVVSDPFTGSYYGKLSPQDSIATRGYDYALQRFGQENKKRIALTFDDGPDAIYTPKILDTLSHEQVVATFFAVGSNVVQNEAIAQRLVREGHVIANHTFSHINFDLESDLRGTEEIIQTGRAIRAATGHSTKLFRAPYAGSNDQSMRNDSHNIALAQQLGYLPVYFTSDSNDWRFTDPNTSVNYPSFDGTSDIIVLLHDGGGNRDKTIEYTSNLISLAKQKGYTFTTISAMAEPYVDNTFTAATPDASDVNAFSIMQGIYYLPKRIIMGLFVFSLVMIFLTTMLNTILAWFNMRKPQLPIKWSRFRPKVGVIVPAYNEGIVLEKTVRSLRASSYKNIEIVMIDDGSTDDTWSIMQRIVRRYKRGVRAIHQPNTGKSGALNNAISQVDCEIVICLDADTIFERTAIAHLVKHFVAPEVGAVAGVVKVGNTHNYITRWQALEYTIGIMLERNAQSLLNAITIVPGACSAWRRQLVLDAGGFSHRTLAEDCDLTYMIHRLGYRVVQENNALSYTEAPQTLRSLMKQRFRWTFGSFQALWVHRDMIFDTRYKMLSNFVMPMTAITILTPLLFWPVVTFITIQNILSGNITVILIFFTASLLLQAIFATIAVRFAREKLSLLYTLPLARFIFSPIRTYIMYRSILTVFTGKYVGWNKLVRTGTVALPPQAVQHTPQATQ